MLVSPVVPYPALVFRPELPIETERLCLRAWSMDDLDAYASQRADPDVVRYLYDEPMSREEAAIRLAELRSELPGPDVWMNLAVVLRETGQVIGAVGLNLRSDLHAQAEVGYVFDLAFGGMGYATEATAAIVDLVFDELGVHRVIARLDARNLASARLCERLGLRREAHLVENEFVKGEWCDELTFAVLDREWAERRDRGQPPRTPAG
jgi:RimJ/RimL family protein N-acetyltransferase